MRRVARWAIVALLEFLLLAGAASAEESTPPAEVLGASGTTLADRLPSTAASESLVADATQSGAAPTITSLEDRLFQLLNAERVARGLQPLQTDPRLTDLARQRSDDLSARDYFSHVTPEGTTVFNTMDRLRIPYRLAGENLGRTNYPLQESPRIVHDALIKSPSHAINEFDPDFNKVGIGAALSTNGFVYYTELFAILD